jgi:hypothetical protein
MTTRSPAEQPVLRNPYHTESGKPRLRKSWVVFIDILGFKEELQEATRAKKQVKLLSRLMTALADAKEYLYYGHRTAQLYGDGYAPFMIKLFTDNLVLGFPVRDDGESEFGQAIFMIALYQFTLLKYGFFVRGGIAFGELYMDEDVVFGSSIIEAYEAESKLARDPRVVFAKSAADLMLYHVMYYNRVRTSPHNRSVLVDADAQLFVSYLEAPTDDCDGEIPGEFRQSLEQFRDLIIARLTRFVSDPRIRPKYEWVAIYHNMMVLDYYQLPDSLCVPTAMLRQSPKSLAEVYQRKGRYLYKGDQRVAEFKSVFEYPVQPRPA